MTLTRRFDILVVGEINPDIIVSDADPSPRYGQAERRVDSIAMTAGSSTVLTALAAARLGLRTAIYGLVGDDPFGRFMLSSLDRGGVDTHACRVVVGDSTGASVILDRGPDRAILTSPGVMASLRAEDVPLELVRDSRHIHVGSWYLQDALRAGLPALFAAARTGGTSTSLDPGWDPDERWSGLDEVLTQTDVFLPNSNEACGIADATDVEEASNVLVAGGAANMTVAVKAGRLGAMAAQGSEVARSKAPDVAVIDTIGAGDGFDAGFLYGRLAGWTIARSLALAVACGALSTRARGGVDGQATIAEALALAATLQPVLDDSAVAGHSA
jgi:sugar/nucleoside kinase (ribokinase family)